MTAHFFQEEWEEFIDLIRDAAQEPPSSDQDEEGVEVEQTGLAVLLAGRVDRVPFADQPARVRRAVANTRAGRNDPFVLPVFCRMRRA